MQETPPTIAETYTQKKEGERKRRPNWKALLFVVIFFGLVLVAGFMQSPLSAVSNIEVKGIHQIRYEDVLKTAGIEKGISFWKINKSEAAAAILKTFPVVSSADVQVSWTGDVVIAVVEKSVSGTLIAKDKLYRLMQDGTVLEGAENSNVPLISMDSPPSVQTGTKATNQDLLELANQMPEVDRSVLDQVSEIHITAEGPWRVFMRDKFEVRIPARQFADKFKEYAKFRSALGADAKPGIINLLESNYFQPYKSDSESTH